MAPTSRIRRSDVHAAGVHRRHLAAIHAHLRRRTMGSWRRSTNRSRRCSSRRHGRRWLMNLPPPTLIPMTGAAPVGALHTTIAPIGGSCRPATSPPTRAPLPDIAGIVAAAAPVCPTQRSTPTPGIGCSRSSARPASVPTRRTVGVSGQCGHTFVGAGRSTSDVERSEVAARCRAVRGAL